MFRFNSDTEYLSQIYTYNYLERAYFIDIQLDNYKDIYHEWDFSAINIRGLDDELMQFIDECCDEIPLKYKIGINFYLPHYIKDMDKEEKTKIGLLNYFNYLTKRNINIKNRLFYSSLKNAGLGSLFLILAFVLKVYVIDFPSFISFGLDIGSWVFFWETSEIVFFERGKASREIQKCKRLAKATIYFNYL